QQVAFGARLGDVRQVRADVAAQVADGVAGEAGRLLTVEDRAAARHVAVLEARQQFVHVGLLLPGVDAQAGVQGRGLLLDRRAEFLEPRLERLDAQARPG